MTKPALFSVSRQCPYVEPKLLRLKIVNFVIQFQCLFLSCNDYLLIIRSSKYGVRNDFIRDTE